MDCRDSTRSAEQRGITVDSKRVLLWAERARVNVTGHKDLYMVSESMVKALERMAKNGAKQSKCHKKTVKFQERYKQSSKKVGKI